MALKETYLSIKDTLRTPFIPTERVDGVGIGKEILPIADFKNLIFSPELCVLLNTLNKPDNNEQRKRLHFHLNWNTADPYGLISHDRPVSAYFTYDPKTQAIIVEWGLIDPKSNQAKLHSYLNRSLNLAERSTEDMKVSSGHLAKLTGSNQYLALFDNLDYETPRERVTVSMARTINTLYNNSIIPITADGYVQLPIF